MKLWDAATGTLVHTFAGHRLAITSAAFSPDGTHVLSGSADSTLKLWDAASGALLRTFEGHSHAIASVAASADGTRIVTGSADTTLKIWDAATGTSCAVWVGIPAGSIQLRSHQIVPVYFPAVTTRR